MYYECLLNSIIVDISESALGNPGFWILCLWGLCATGVYLFIESFPASAQGQYFLPIITFLVFVFSKWNINSYLIGLPAFCATDPEFARTSLDQAARVYVPEKQLRCAFENVDDELKVRAFQNPTAMKLSTPAFFGLLRDACDKEMSMFPEEKWGGPGPLQNLLAMFGIIFRPVYSARFPKISRPEVMTTPHSLRNGFWAYRILFHEQLCDIRATSFRRWFSAFVVFAIFEITLCTLALLWILSSFLVHERLVEPDSTLVWWLRLGNTYAQHSQPQIHKEFELSAVDHVLVGH
jgi:hypothetical protein